MSELSVSDDAVLDLLRERGEMTVSELALCFDVTATAIRQRLNRLMSSQFVERRTVVEGRGRPSHRYSLTSAGLRQAGSNFGDLAMALWEELRAVKDPDVRRGLLQRIACRLADSYSEQIAGKSIEQKMKSLAALFGSRKIPLSVDARGELPVLTAAACPYPELAEKDRSICAMEKMMLSELVGETLHLAECRLDGDTCCTFELT